MIIFCLQIDQLEANSCSWLSGQDCQAPVYNYLNTFVCHLETYNLKWWKEAVIIRLESWAKRWGRRSVSSQFHRLETILMLSFNCGNRVSSDQKRRRARLKASYEYTILRFPLFLLLHSARSVQHHAACCLLRPREAGWWWYLRLSLWRDCSFLRFSVYLEISSALFEILTEFWRHFLPLFRVSFFLFLFFLISKQTTIRASMLTCLPACLWLGLQLQSILSWSFFHFCFVPFIFPKLFLALASLTQLPTYLSSLARPLVCHLY